MTPTIEKLLKVQEHDCRLLRLQRECRELPDHKKGIEARLDEYRQRIQQASLAVKERQAANRKLEGEIESRKERIRKLREQQLQLKTNKEFKAMDTEIGAVQSEINRLEEQTLAGMELVEQAQAEVKDGEKALQAEQDTLKGDLLNLDRRALEIKAEIEKLELARKAEVADVEPKWLRQYERIFNNKKDKALVSVENGTCNGCHMHLPPYLVHEARRQSDIVTCGFCGRMLFLE